MRARLLLTAGVMAVVAGLAASACGDTPPPPKPCHDIPTGGCPLSGANACADPTCTAVYACTNGAWTFDHMCPPPSGTDAGTDAAMDADAAPPPLFDAAFDVPPGADGVGCSGLQPPDCTLDTAITCGPGCCQCEDLFICQDASWIPWGQCVDGGIVPP